MLDCIVEINVVMNVYEYDFVDDIDFYNLSLSIAFKSKLLFNHFESDVIRVIMYHVYKIIAISQNKSVLSKS